MGRHYSTGEVAQALGCSRRTVVNYIEHGKIKAHRLPPTNIGHGHRRVTREALEKFMQEHGIPLSRLV